MLTALSGLDGLARLKRRAAARRRGNKLHGGPQLDDFLRVARQSFVHLQQAWDAGDMAALSGLTTESLLLDLREQLEARGAGPNSTEVLRLEARLLGIDEVPEAFIASVEFSGLIRERSGDRAAPFTELWMLVNMKTAHHGWRLARVQALG